MEKERLIYITFRFPNPPTSGEKIRAYYTLEYLTKKYNVTLISLYSKDSDLNQLEKYKSFFEKIVLIKQNKFNSYYKALIGLFFKKPLQVSYYNSSKLKKALNKVLKNNKYNIIFYHLIRTAQYLPSNNINIKNIVDFTDAISLNYQRSYKYQKGLWKILNFIENKRILNYELDILNRIDLGIFISEIDANFIKNNSNQNKIRIVPNGVDFTKFAFNNNYDPSVISFIGHMNTFPNRNAVTYFIQEIFYRVKKCLPNVRFYIIGGSPTKEILKYHNGNDIIVTGFVDDIIHYYAKSCVVVAPMRVGAGMQNKILESLSVGTPVVTTTIGSEGLNKEFLTIADNPDDFAKKTIDIMLNKDLRYQISTKGRKYIEDNFNWDKVFEKLNL